MNFLWQEEEEVEDTLKDRYLTFKVGEQGFAIAIATVVEIIGVQPIVPVPEFPSYAKGIINLRGKIIPTIDTRLRFGLEEVEDTDRTCIIIIDHNGFSLGLIVEQVDEVIIIPEESLSEAPKYHENMSTRFIRGVGQVGNEVILLADVEQMITHSANESMATYMEE